MKVSSGFAKHVYKGEGSDVRHQPKLPFTVLQPRASVKRCFYEHLYKSQTKAFASCCGGGGNNGNAGGKPVGNGGDSGGEGSTGYDIPVMLCLAILGQAAPAHALLGKKAKKQRKPSAEINKLADLSWPILQNLGFSGVLGILAAVAFKTAGRVAAFVIGIFFSFVQFGAYLGYVKVDWAKVHRDVLKSFDVNQDGKFDASDFKAIMASLFAVLSQGVPSVGGFTTGFSLGLRL